MASIIINIVSIVAMLAPICLKVFPKLAPMLANFFVRFANFTHIMAIVAAIGAVVSKLKTFIIGFLNGFPSWFIKLFGKGGALYWIFNFLKGIKTKLGWRAIFFIVFMLGTWFDTIFEFFFLVIGGVSLRILTVVTKWAFNKQMSEDNTETLVTIMGDSIDNLPPCMIDVMGYLHLVEDLGMIISTLIFVGILNLITRLYYRWL